MAEIIDLSRRRFLIGAARAKEGSVHPDWSSETGTATKHIASVSDSCLSRRGIVCQSCRDACPEAAIRFVPRRGGPFLPEVRVADCTGCGACAAACPVSAIGLASVPEFADA